MSKVINQKQPKEEKPKLAQEEDFYKIKNLLNKKDKNYTPQYILRTLNEKEKLRRTFLGIIKNNPSKISEITEYTLYPRNNQYALLANLVSLGIIERIWVADLFSGKTREDIIKNKFEEWTSKMQENTRRYYVLKTSYWKITDFGKQFVVKAYAFDQIFREGEIGK